MKRKLHMLAKHSQYKTKRKWTTTFRYILFIRVFKKLYLKKFKKSYYNTRFAPSIITQHCRPIDNLRFQKKNFFQKTNSRLLSHFLTKNTIFCSSNSLIMFSKIWNKVWLTDETDAYIMAIDFLAEDLKLFRFIKRQYLSLRSRNSFSMITSAKKVFQKFFLIYLELSNRIIYRIYFYMFHLKPRIENEFVVYRLYLTFTSSRIFANLGTTNSFSNNYFSLSLGLFLKFFKKKKSMKKKKIFKILLLRYIRKLFLIVGIINIELYINRTPLLLDELLNSLRTPADIRFVDPLNECIYKDFEKPVINLMSIKFNTPKPYGPVKGPRKGRLKRRIMRRLIRTYRVSD